MFKSLSHSTDNPQISWTPRSPIPIVAQSNILNEDGTFQNRTWVTRKDPPASSKDPILSSPPMDSVFELRYIADENGFQPQASFLPVAPPIPEDIQRSLEYNAAHPEEDNLRK
uniref:Uncharacterized protein n=1 Tax=Timema genevievae TaxID=629358 RepID=A0A7R9JUI9_TIMGE|nr:unnamed protein product [Timema genevievae]